MIKKYDWIEKFTEKETEILQLLVDHSGDYDAIAKKLVVSRVTVLTHVHHIFCKLRVKNKTAAIIEALKRNIVTLTAH